jgi:hypothetical protein
VAQEHDLLEKKYLVHVIVYNIIYYMHVCKTYDSHQSLRRYAHHPSDTNKHGRDNMIVARVVSIV